MASPDRVSIYRTAIASILLIQNEILHACAQSCGSQSAFGAQTNCESTQFCCGSLCCKQATDVCCNNRQCCSQSNSNCCMPPSTTTSWYYWVTAALLLIFAASIFYLCIRYHKRRSNLVTCAVTTWPQYGDPGGLPFGVQMTHAPPNYYQAVLLPPANDVLLPAAPPAGRVVAASARPPQGAASQQLINGSQAARNFPCTPPTMPNTAASTGLLPCAPPAYEDSNPNAVPAGVENSRPTIAGQRRALQSRGGSTASGAPPRRSSSVPNAAILQPANNELSNNNQLPPLGAFRRR